MANFFIDHGAYASTLGTAPAWGVPQEGDGSTKDAATSSGVASVVFSSVPSTGTLSLCGVSISTTGVLGAASVDAAANALAANINATTSTVGTSVSAAAPQLRNLVFARGPSSGAAAGTCEVMMRVGSETLNHANNASVGVVQTFSPSATLSQFSGGLGGCWGWLWNTAAIGVASSYAVASYGCVPMAEYMASTVPGGTTTVKPGAGDVIWVRANNKIITHNSTSSPIAASGRSFQTHYVVDTNTVWQTDPANATLTLDFTLQGSNNVSIGFAAGGSGTGVPSSVSAIGYGGLVVRAVGSAANATFSVSNSSGGGTLLFRNVWFVESAEVVATSRLAFGVTNTSWNVSTTFERCKFDFKPAISAIKNGALFSVSNSWGIVECRACEFIWNITGPADPGPIVSINLSVSNQQVWRFIGNRFSGYSGKFTAVSGTPNAQRPTFAEFRFEANSGLKLLSNTFLSIAGPDTNARAQEQACLLFTSSDSGRPMRYETYGGVADWDNAASPAYPTLAAVLKDGTPWSVRMLWFATDAATPARPYTGPKLVQQNLHADGLRTIRVEMLVPTAVTLDACMLSALVTYTDSAGVSRAQTTYGTQVPSASGAAWAGMANYPNHSKVKLEVATDAAVAQYTDVSVQVCLHRKSPTGALESLYVDPEFSIT